MKKLIFLLFLLSGLSKSYAQYKDFGSIGAKWTYEVTNYSYGRFYGGRHGFETIESVKDTIFKGKQCHLLVRYKDDSLSIYHDLSTDTFYCYTDTMKGRVHFCNDKSHFFTLYNFGQKQGDTNHMIVPGDTIYYTVYKRDTISINNYKLINISMSCYPPFEYWSFLGHVYEKIGNLQYMLPQYDDPSDNSGTDHAFRLLRCYEDSQFSYRNEKDYYGQKYFDKSWPCDTVYHTAITGIVNIKNEEVSVSAYPNPFTDHIKILLPELSPKILITITDMEGRVLYSELSNSQSLVTIPTEKLKSGLYMLHLSSDKINTTRKLIK